MPEVTEPTTEPAEPVTEPHGTEPSKEETDWKAEARKREQRAKENKDAATKLKELEDAQLSELEKAQKLAAEAKAEADQLKAEKARSEAVRAAAAASGVDFDVLNLMAGDTPEQIAANAELLKEKTADNPIYPTVPDNGVQGRAAISKEEIEGIKDPVERIRKIAQHKELYQ